MKPASAEGAFWSKKSTIPSGIGEDGFNPFSYSILNLAASTFDLTFCNLNSHIVIRNSYEIGSRITFSDFKLHRKRWLTFNGSGIKERTYMIRDASGLIWYKSIDFL